MDFSETIKFSKVYFLNVSTILIIYRIKRIYYNLKPIFRIENLYTFLSLTCPSIDV